MKKLIYIMASAALFFIVNAKGEKNGAAAEAHLAKISKNNFLPDWEFSGRIYQVIDNPIVWSDDRSLAVISDETASGAICYTFWCLKRNEQGTMEPIARYKI